MTIGINEINALFKIDSFINRIVVSEKTIKKNPKRKIIVLYLL